jgi:hypothetical protein
MHAATRMKTTRFIAAAALAAGSVLGCTRESSRGPVNWTASNPSSSVGQTAAQAWSRSTSSDTPQPGREPQPPPSVARAPAGALEGASPCPQAPEQPAGVTNAQPPPSRWPYDGVTLQLEPPP